MAAVTLAMPSEADAQVITCQGGTCAVQAGLSLQITGDSSATALPYHVWSWQNASGVASGSSINTTTQQYRSVVTFDANNFQAAATRTVTLQACSTNFNSGTCLTSTQQVTINAAPVPILTCSTGAACEVRAGSTVRLIGDATGSRLQYHRWEWTNVAGSPQGVNQNAFQGGYMTQQDLVTNGWQVGDSVRMTLFTCSANYSSVGAGAGTCSQASQVVTIIAPAQPSITCDVANCTTQIGKLVTLTGDSATGNLRYHRWTLPTAAGSTSQPCDWDAFSTGMKSECALNTAGFTMPGTLNVTLQSCAGGYNSGTCTTQSRTVTLTAAPEPTLQCADNWNCQIPMGSQTTLFGWSQNSNFRYHQYTWTNAAGTPVTETRDAESYGKRSQADFSASGFNGAAPITVRVDFYACTGGYRVGTCAQTFRNIVITPVPAATVTCQPANCTVQAGRSIPLFADSRTSQLPYHRWEWTTATGTNFSLNQFTAGTGYQSTTPFNANGFNTTAATRTVQFTACSAGYGTGTCVRTEQIINITVAPDATINCSTGPACRVPAGGTVELIGNAVGSRFRYHDWQWRNSANQTVNPQIDTAATNYTSRPTFDSNGYQGMSNIEVVATLVACTQAWRAGSCVTQTKTVVIVPSPLPQIACIPSCTVQAGQNIDLVGTSSTAELRYHEWQWNTVSGSPISPLPRRDTLSNPTHYTSRVTFTSQGWSDATTVPVTLVACSGGYSSGSCARITQNITLTQPPAPVITCPSGAACTVVAGGTMDITGDTGSSRYRYHEWTWNDGRNTAQTYRRDVIFGDWRSVNTFSAQYYTGNATNNVNLRLRACTNNYGSLGGAGSCVERTQVVQVVPVDAPQILCPLGNCSLPINSSIVLVGDSGSQWLPYHEWRYRNSTGSALTSQQQATSVADANRTTFTFQSTNFGAGTTTVDLNACSNGYNTGTCRLVSLNLNIATLPAGVITCDTGSCNVQPGFSMQLNGDTRGTGAASQYHEYSWPAPGGGTTTQRVNTGASYTSAVTFNATGYPAGPTTVTVTLNACGTNFNTPPCNAFTRDITVGAANVPVIACSSGAGCQVQQGSPGGAFRLTGDTSGGSRYPYHDWQWRDPYNNLQRFQLYTAATGFKSQVNFTPNNYQGTTPIQVPVELVACYNNWRAGSCVTQTQIVTVIPAVAPTITCVPANCRVQAGQSLALIGDSGPDSYLRYHDWRWRNSTEAIVNDQIDAYFSKNRSNTSFSANGWINAATETVELTVCSNSYRAGTCRTVTQQVTIDPAPALSIVCAPPNADCTVQAGLGIDLIADSGNSQFRFQRWTWEDATGRLNVSDRDTLDQSPGSNYKSKQRISAAGFLNTANQTVRTRVSACTNGYDSGSCVFGTRDFVVTPAPLPSIDCATAGCRVQAGNSLEVSGNSANAQLRYHTYRWREASGGILETTRDSFQADFQTTMTFSADGFQAADTRDITLIACSTGYRNGTCVETTRTITIDAAPALDISCGVNAVCEVTAGRSLQITGDSSAAQYRFHDWSWTRSSGSPVLVQSDTSGTSNRSTVTFSAGGFEGNVPETVNVTLIACTQWWRQGSCLTRTTGVRVNPAPTISLTCATDPCRVQAGKSVELTSTASVAALRFHEWLWTDAAGQNVITSRDLWTGGTATYGGFTSSVFFNANGFNAAGMRTAEVLGCTNDFRIGTCRRASIPITVDAAPAPTVTCFPADCSVTAGTTLLLTGDAASARFPYQEWRWVNGAGSPVVNQDFRTDSAYRWTIGYNTTGFNPTANQVVNVEYWACTSNYRSGSCVSRVTPITVRPAPAPTITCLGNPTCAATNGVQIQFIGDSQSSQLRYHTYTWFDANGVETSFNDDALNQVYRSTYSFTPNNFLGQNTRRLELLACTNAWGSGTCARATRDFTINPNAIGVITCNPASCRAEVNTNIALSGNTANSGLRYHHWRWQNNLGQPVTTQVDTMGTFVSGATFSTTGFPVGTTRVVELVACDNGFLTGTCRTITQNMFVDAAAGPRISCSSGAACQVRMGTSITLTGDSNASSYRYHAWRVIDGPSVIGTEFFDTNSTGFRSTTTFNANSFRGNSNVPITVELISCNSGYRSGNCGTRTQVVTVIPVTAATVTCDNGCSVQAGQAISMIADSRASSFRWHTWQYRDANGTIQEFNRDGGSAFQTTQTFNAISWTGAATGQVNLWACSNTYRSGSCTLTTQDIQITDPPLPTITCSSGAMCRVQAGLTMELTGDSSNSRFRYHAWRWLSATGAFQDTLRDSDSSGYQSTVTFNASPYQPTANQTVTAELVACTSPWRQGVCVTRTQVVTIVPAPAVTIACSPATCRVQAGLNMRLTGDSRSSSLRYHTWRWRTALGGTTYQNLDTDGTSNVSVVTFPASDFQAGTTHTIELWACSVAWRSGTCTTTTRTVTIDTPAVPTIACLGGSCRIPAGSALELTGDSSGSQFLWHDWRWSLPAGGASTVQRQASGGAFRSTISFNTSGYQIATDTTIRVELVVCNDSYRQGSCSRTTQDIVVVAQPAPQITCETGPNCRVQAGLSMGLIGNSANSLLRFHEWRWRGPSGNPVTPQIDTLGTSYLSSTAFNAVNFTSSSTQTLQLVACSAGYGAGTCAVASRPLVVNAPPRPAITCRTPDCSMLQGDTLDVFGSSASSQFRYHEWRWPNSAGAIQIRQTDTINSDFVSSFPFSGNGFESATPVTVTLELWACTNWFRDGSCTTTTRNVTIVPLAVPTITCETGSGCTVRSNGSIVLNADSSASGLRYHEWRWRDAAGAEVVLQNDTINGGYRSTRTFTASGFTQATTRVIEVYACSAGYYAGTCVRGTQTINVAVPPPVFITCSPTNCLVQPTFTLSLTGESSGSNTTYHRWSWSDVNNMPVTTDLRTDGNFRTFPNFVATGFPAGMTTTRMVTLIACDTGYTTGTCVNTTQTITIGPSNRPVITCSSGAACTVRAGETIDLYGDSTATQFPFHSWRWNNPDNVPLDNPRDARSSGNVSVVTFSADDFQGPDPITVTIDLMACQNGYRTGSCSQQTRDITVLPATPATITCTPANCTVPFGESISLRGDSLASGLRYHRWRWRNPTAGLVTTDRDTRGTGFSGNVTFSAVGYSAPTVEPIELFACASGYRNGTCTRTTINVNVVAPATPTIRCNPADCSVAAGQSIQLIGDAAAAEFRYHDWRWPNAAGETVTTQVDAFSGNYVSTVTFSANFFQNTANQQVTAELVACTGAWRVGSCMRRTQVITVTPVRDAVITCIPANCTVQGGQSLQLNGDSVAGRLRYHEWRWRNAAGSLVNPTADTNGVGFASSFNFDANNFEEATTRVVELTACTSGYPSGTCSRVQRTITVTAPVVPTITCSTGASCAISSGLDIQLTGDSSLSELPYHEWTYDTVESTVTVFNANTNGTAWRSTVSIPTRGFQPTQNTTINATLVACRSWWRQGTCARRSQVITITPPTAPQIRCLTSPDCTLPAGTSLDLTGYSSASNLRYHYWTWYDHTGNVVQSDRDTASTGYISTVNFNAGSYLQPTTRTVELRSCSNTNGGGTCISTTQVVTITAPLAPQLSCNPTNCRVPLNASMQLTADAQGQSLRWHEWRWNGPGGTQVITRRDGGTSFATTVTFDTTGFTPPAEQNVELVACTAGYLTGFCATSTILVGVDNRAAPTITCEPGSNCTVLAGRSIQLFGDSINTQMPYHGWRWRNYNNGFTQPTIFTQNQGFRSVTTFSADYFNPTAPMPVTVELYACESNWRQGNCGTTAITVTILPVRAPNIRCTPGTCTTQAGLSLVMAGTSSTSELRYHTWEYRDQNGTIRRPLYDTFNTAFRSQFTFDASGFEQGTTVRFDLWACSAGWRVGTCSTVTRSITIQTAPAPSITCASGAGCTVPMGQTLQLFGDSSSSQFRYHEFTWDSAEGVLVTPQRDTASTNYRSSVNMDTVGFQGTQPVTVRVALSACTDSYRLGSCVYTTRDVTVTPVAAPTITCGRTNNCTIQAGQALDLFGDSGAGRLQYHTWRWLDATNSTTIVNRDTVNFSFRSTATFDSERFQTGGTRTILLTTCTGAWEVGTCTSATRDITITPAPLPTITCLEDPQCRVQAGRTLTLVGDASGSRFRYHSWMRPNESAANQITNIDSFNQGYRSTITFDANGFEPTANQTFTIELEVCNTGWPVNSQPGSCVRRTQVVTVTPEPQATITCLVPNANCELQAGLSISLAGDSGNSTLRYHEWRWNDYSGTEVITQRDTTNTSNRSNVSFTASGWSGNGTRTVTLVACSEWYLEGTCTTITRTITIVPPVPAFITCDPGSCIIVRGFTLTLMGDSTGSATPFHTWRWQDSAGAQINQNINANGTRNTSQTTFNAAGFAGPATRDVTLTACTTGYGTGTCVTVTRTIQIDNAPAPTITCPGVPNCTVQAGNFIDLLGNSLSSQYQYHDWRWPGSNGAFVNRQLNSIGFNYTTITRLDADGFPGGGATEVNVELAACTTGYRTGACVFTSRIITVLPAAVPRIDCQNPGCRVQSGLTMDLVGTATSARFRYHRWNYLDSTGTLRNFDRDTGGSGFISVFNFDATGFRQTTTQEVLLQVCTQGYNAGSCRSTTREITIETAPEPTITCQNADCTVRAGTSMTLFGNSLTSGYRYHHWEWEDSAGNIIATNRDTISFGYASSAEFSAVGYNNTANQAVAVSLTACTGGFAFQGSCTTRTINVIITPAPGAVVTCMPANCRVQAGLTMGLRGDASAARLRYHRWRWQDASGLTQALTYDTDSFGYVSAPTFDANGFQGAASRTVDFTACSTGYGTGTCVSRSVPVGIDAAPAPVISCPDSATCTVRAGATMDLFGDSSLAQFRYHQWTWNNASGAPITPINRDTNNGGFRSNVVFSATDYPAGASAMVNVTLRACTTGYGTGSCTSRTQQLNIGNTTPPIIQCSTPDCSVQAGLTLVMTADTNATGLPYHTWSWMNALNQSQPATPNVDTTNTGFVSAQTFNADGFTTAATRTVEVRACATGYGQGTCVTARRDVRIEVAPIPRFTCSTGANCLVVVGSTVQITGTSSVSQLRFHSWRWLNASMTMVNTDLTANTTTYQTTVTFNASGFPATMNTPVAVQLNTCATGYGTGTCVLGTMTVTVVPAGPATILPGTVTVRTQPERADYRFENIRPADWTIELFRRVNGMCTTELISTRQVSSQGVVTGTWSGLSPGQSYCWNVVATPTGTGSTQSGTFDVPTVPTFTSGPTAIVAGGVTVTATASAPGQGRGWWVSGTCANQQTRLVSDGVSIVTFQGPVLPLDGFTWEGWVNLRGVTDQTRRILSFGGSVELSLTTGALQLLIRTPAVQQLTTSATVASDRWVHLAASWRAGGDMRLYIDGVRRAQQVATAGNLTNNNTGMILGALANQGFLGDISSMAVYARELTQTEILNHATVGPNEELPMETNPRGYWDFSEAVGVQSVYDRSGNGWAGVLGTNYTLEASDPQRQPQFQGSNALNNASAIRGPLTNLTGGPNYCYRITSDTAFGTIASNLGTFFRMVADTTAPVVVPDALTVLECASMESTTTTLQPPNVTDNTDPNPVVVPTVGGSVITFPYRFPYGETVVRWRATDSSGNQGFGNQTVRVRDITNPTINGGPVVVIEATDPAGTPYTPAPDSASDTCSAVTVTNNGPARYPLGDTVVTFTVRDTAGNNRQGTRTVRVQDTTPPQFSPPLGTVTYLHDGSNCFTPTLFPPTVTDNGYANFQLVVMGNRTAGPAFPTCWDLGTHTVEWTVSDPDGNTTRGTQTVIVQTGTNSLTVMGSGIEVNGMSVPAGRYYRGPVTVVTTVSGGSAPYALRLTPMPTSQTRNGNTFRSVYDAPGDYSRIQAQAQDGDGTGANIGQAVLNGFGIDTTPPVVENFAIGQTGVTIGTTATYPYVFVGEELNLESLRARDGAAVPEALLQAARFDGTDVITVPNPQGGFFTDGNVTGAMAVEAWVRFDNPGDRVVVSKPAQDGLSSAFSLGLTAQNRARFTLLVAGTTITLTGGRVEANRWHHLAGRYDGRAVQLWVDAQPAAYRLATGSVTVGAQPLVIGAEINGAAPTSVFAGDITDVALWRTAITEAELARHFRGGVGRGVFPTAEAAGVWHMDGAGQDVRDASARQNHGRLGQTPAEEADDPTRVVLTQPADPTSSGLVSVTVRLREIANNTSSAMISTSSTATGFPLAVGYRLFGGRACNAPVGSVCNPGERNLTVANIRTMSQQRLGAYHIEITATDAAGNMTMLPVGIRTQDYAGALQAALADVEAMINDPLNASATNELRGARESFSVARAYATMNPAYMDGSYLRADQGVQYLLDAQVLNVDIGRTAEYVSRAMAGNIRTYVNGLTRDTLPTDVNMWNDAQRYLTDARFEVAAARFGQVDALVRTGLDAVALLYPSYQPMRRLRRDVRARFDAQLAGYNPASAEQMRTDGVRLTLAMQMMGATRDMLRETLYREITAALTNPLTTQRSSLTELQDVLDKSSSMPDEAGDLIAITSAVNDACLDRLATFTLSDETFTRCYIRLNDLARALDSVQEGLVYTYRWRAGVGLALFNMLEASMFVSPTGLPWVTSGATLPAVQLVLPDALAVTGAIPVSQVDTAGAPLARAYMQYQTASVAMRDGDVNQAWSLFVAERCLLLGLYNRYYSTNRMPPNVGDDPNTMMADPVIDPMSVGCAP